MNSRTARSIFLLSILAIAAAAHAQQAQPKRVAIKAGRLVDVRTGNVATNVFIVVEGERIASVGGSAPAGVEIIDLSNATVLPGLIDAHAHVLGNLKDQSPTSTLRMSSAQSALWGVRNLQVWLAKGFTALREAGEADLSYGHIALRDSVRNGLIRGPRMVSAGSWISLTGGHGDADVLSPDQSLPRRPNLADSVAEIGPAVRRDIKYGADWIKLMATGGVGDPMSDYSVQELSEEQMAKAVELAHRAHKKVMAHAEGTEGIKAAVRAGVDSIEHGTMLDEEGATLMEQHGTWLVPTLNVFQREADVSAAIGYEAVSTAKIRAILKYQQPSFERALKHHVKVAFGVDDDPEFVDKEFGALVRGGMSPLDAVRAATINGAELLGLTSEIGTIEPGKYADIIAVTGDPLRDIQAMSQIVFVMKGGDVIRNDMARSR